MNPKRLSPSASHLKLLEVCAWPFRPDAPEPPKEKFTRKADVGKAVHRLNEWLLRGELGTKHYPADATIEFRVPGSEIARVYASHEHWATWWRAEGEPRFKPELAFEYHTGKRTARPLPGVSERDYPHEPDCIYGTADGVLVEPGRVWITDTKTGDPRYVDRTRVNHQMKFLSLCAMRVYPVDVVRATLQFVDEEGIINDDAEYDWLELDDFEEWLCKRYREIPTAQPTRGDWCRDRWCKYRPRSGYVGCPAWAPETEKEAI